MNTDIEDVLGITVDVAEANAAEPEVRPAPELRVSPDQMAAYLTLRAPSTAYTRSEIDSLLDRHRIAHGVDGVRLDLVLSLGVPVYEELIASGTLPGDPADGYVEWMFPMAAAELEEHGGRVDWRNLHLVHSVPAHAPVARRHAAAEGEPGLDVHGRPVKARRRPRDARIRLGSGVAFSSSDPDLVVSVLAGAVRVDGNNRISVESTFVVKGDLNLTTGNIEDFDGSVVVEGDVKKGFVIKASGNVEVRGIVEDATIIAGGSITCQGVLASSTRSPLQAGRDVMAKFASGAMILAQHDILLGQEAVNCELEAWGRILVGGMHPVRGAVRGGTAQAGQEIVGYDVGSSGSKSKLRVGFDWLLPKVLPAIEAQIVEQKKMLDELRRKLQVLQEARGRNALNAQQMQALEQLRVAEEAGRFGVRTLESRHKNWMSLAEAKGSIAIYGTAFDGTELTVDGKSKVLMEARRAQRFIVEANQVIGLSVNHEYRTRPVYGL